jgi:hypothetical protein
MSFVSYSQSDEVIDKTKIMSDTTIVLKVLQLPSGSYGTATLSSTGDSIRVYVIGGMNQNAKILVSWHGVNFLGELGVRNRSPDGFTIFSNTDEVTNIEVIYLILDNKIMLP